MGLRAAGDPRGSPVVVHNRNCLGEELRQKVGHRWREVDQDSLASLILQGAVDRKRAGTHLAPRGVHVGDILRSLSLAGILHLAAFLKQNKQIMLNYILTVTVEQ